MNDSGYAKGLRCSKAGNVRDQTEERGVYTGHWVPVIPSERKPGRCDHYPPTGNSHVDVACLPPLVLHVCRGRRKRGDIAAAMAAFTASRLSPPRLHCSSPSPHPPLRRSRFSPLRAAKYAPFFFDLCFKKP